MKKIKVLVTGANGLVGSRFVELSQKYELYTPDQFEVDLTNEDSVFQYVKKVSPDWIVNFAAFTDVNAAEQQTGDETGSVWQVNVQGVHNLVNAFMSDRIIQISTDMVFPGTISQPGPYAENAQTAKESSQLTWYGWSKNQAEKIILNHGGSILRLIYPVRATFADKLDFIRTPLKRFVEGKMYPLFYDQQISISHIDDIADTLQAIIDQDARGIFHTSTDTTTPFDLISYTLEQLGEDVSLLQKASIFDFLKTQDNPNRYPVYGGLKTNLTEKGLDLRFPAWQTVVEKLIAQGLSLPKTQN